MNCNHLTEATSALFQLSPKPSIIDIARTVCGNCNRAASCPSLKLEQVEWLEQRTTKDAAVTSVRRNS